MEGARGVYSRSLRRLMRNSIFQALLRAHASDYFIISISRVNSALFQALLPQHLLLVFLLPLLSAFQSPLSLLPDSLYLCSPFRHAQSKHLNTPPLQFQRHPLERRRHFLEVEFKRGGVDKESRKGPGGKLRAGFGVMEADLRGIGFEHDDDKRMPNFSTCMIDRMKARNKLVQRRILQQLLAHFKLSSPLRPLTPDLLLYRSPISQDKMHRPIHALNLLLGGSVLCFLGCFFGGLSPSLLYGLVWELSVCGILNVYFRNSRRRTVRQIFIKSHQQGNQVRIVTFSHFEIIESQKELLFTKSKVVKEDQALLYFRLANQHFRALIKRPQESSMLWLLQRSSLLK